MMSAAIRVVNTRTVRRFDLANFANSCLESGRTNTFSLLNLKVSTMVSKYTQCFHYCAIEQKYQARFAEVCS